ncbi:Hypothetical protein HVR_LOCUS892, partial [uncultured virus]
VEIELNNNVIGHLQADNGMSIITIANSIQVFLNQQGYTARAFTLEFKFHNLQPGPGAMTYMGIPSLPTINVNIPGDIYVPELSTITMENAAMTVQNKYRETPHRASYYYTVIPSNNVKVIVQRRICGLAEYFLQGLPEPIEDVNERRRNMLLPLG